MCQQINFAVVGKDGSFSPVTAEFCVRWTHELILLLKVSSVAWSHIACLNLAHDFILVHSVASDSYSINWQTLVPIITSIVISAIYHIELAL